jgi:hypothetical protein
MQEQCSTKAPAVHPAPRRRRRIGRRDQTRRVATLWDYIPDPKDVAIGSIRVEGRRSRSRRAVWRLTGAVSSLIAPRLPHFQMAYH